MVRCLSIAYGWPSRSYASRVCLTGLLNDASVQKSLSKNPASFRFLSCGFLLCHVLTSRPPPQLVYVLTVIFLSRFSAYLVHFQGDEALSEDRIELDNQLHVFEAVMNKDIAEVSLRAHKSSVNTSTRAVQSQSTRVGDNRCAIVLAPPRSSSRSCCSSANVAGF